jgi:hypothetical protein
MEAKRAKRVLSGSKKAAQKIKAQGIDYEPPAVIMQ